MKNLNDLRDERVTTMEDLRDAFLACRTYSHAWDERPATEYERPEPGFWWLYLVCMRCETSRLDLVDSNGDCVSRRYTYPDGYELDETVTRSQMRNEWGRRHDYLSRPTRRRKAS